MWSLSRGRVVERDADGKAKRMTGVNVDIDDRKRAEAELKVSGSEIASGLFPR